MVEVFKSTLIRRMTTGGNYVNLSADVVLLSDHEALRAELEQVERDNANLKDLLDDARSGAAKLLADRIKTEAAQRLAGARVKALEWEAREERRLGATTEKIWRAQTVFDRGYRVKAYGKGFSFGDATEYPTIDTAKAAAQADYERRILSALEPAATDAPANLADDDVDAAYQAALDNLPAEFRGEIGRGELDRMVRAIVKAHDSKWERRAKAMAHHHHSALQASIDTSKPAPPEGRQPVAGAVRVCPVRDAICPHGMGCLYNDGMDCDMESSCADLAYQKEAASRTRPSEQAVTEAAGPFVTFANHAIEKTDDGWVWRTSSNERICDWFGPSDFGALKAAMEAEG